MRQAEHQDKNNPGKTAAAPEFPGIPHKTVRATSQRNPHPQTACTASPRCTARGRRPGWRQTPPAASYATKPGGTRTIEAVSRGPKYCEAFTGKVSWGTGEQGSPQGYGPEVPLPGPHRVQGMGTPERSYWD